MSLYFLKYLECISFEVPRCKTISVGTARTSTENKTSYRVRNVSVPDSIGETSHTFSGYFPFLASHGKDSEGFRQGGRIHRDFYSERIKGFIQTLLRAVSDDKFLHKKINN